MMYEVPSDNMKGFTGINEPTENCQLNLQRRSVLQSFIVKYSSLCLADRHRELYLTILDCFFDHSVGLWQLLIWWGPQSIKLK